MVLRNTFYHLNEEKAFERKTQKKIPKCNQKSFLDLRLQFLKLDQSFKWLNHCYSKRAKENNCAASKNNYITAWLQNTYISLPKVLVFLAFEVSIQNLINKCKHAEVTGAQLFSVKVRSGNSHNKTLDSSYTTYNLSILSSTVTGTINSSLLFSNLLFSPMPFLSNS